MKPVIVVFDDTVIIKFVVTNLVIKCRTQAEGSTHYSRPLSAFPTRNTIFTYEEIVIKI